LVEKPLTGVLAKIELLTELLHQLMRFIGAVDSDLLDLLPVELYVEHADWLLLLGVHLLLLKWLGFVLEGIGGLLLLLLVVLLLKELRGSVRFVPS